MPPFLKRWYWYCWKCRDIYARHYTLNVVEFSGKLLDRVVGTKLGPRISRARHVAFANTTLNKVPFTLRNVLHNFKNRHQATS